jgi:hypothetical protein
MQRGLVKGGALTSTKGDYPPEGKDTAMNYSTYLALILATTGHRKPEDVGSCQGEKF